MPEPMRTTGQALTQMRTRRYSEPTPGRRSVRRPEDIQRDVRGLKLRQRVTLVLNDDYIRHELEDTMRKHSDDSEELASVRTYQDFLVPSSNYYGAMPGVSAIYPINDIRGTDTLNYTKSERNLRCKLASVYRLLDVFGWTENIYNHCTVRCPAEHGRGESFLINPFGLLYNEITASSLVKVDADGEILDGGSTNLGINKAGFVIHSAVHMSRKDAKCAIHVHEPSTVAVASCKHGILPISQTALILGPISYHDFEGIACDEEERERLIKDFPEGSRVMVLKNHGLLCVGETVEEAFFYLYSAVQACQIQVKAMSAGVDNLIHLDKDMQNKVYETVRSQVNNTKKPNVGVGVVQFEAWMRMLDSQGHRTGYVYHNPDLYNKTAQQPKSEARSPATMTSLRYDMMFGDNQNSSARRARSLGKGNTYKNRSKWLNTPVKGTEYRKEFTQDIHSEPAILKDRRPEKETVVKILEESKGPASNENIIQEKITSTKPEIVMSEIPLESIFDDETSEQPEVIEKGLNDAETKEVKPTQVRTTEVKTVEVKPAEGGGTVTTSKTSTRVVTTSRTVVKGDGSPVTTVEEKVIVNGEEQPDDPNLLSPPVEAEVEDKDKEGSEDGEKGKGNEKEAEGAEGGKPRQKVKKKRSFKKTFQGMMHRRSKSDKDEDDEKS